MRGAMECTVGAPAPEINRFDAPLHAMSLRKVKDSKEQKPEKKKRKELIREDPRETIPVFAARKYKPVANRVKPVKTTLPEELRIVRKAHKDALQGLPVRPTHPPEFTPGERYTIER